jgi:hypothetical protein
VCDVCCVAEERGGQKAPVAICGRCHKIYCEHCRPNYMLAGPEILPQCRQCLRAFCPECVLHSTVVCYKVNCNCDPPCVCDVVCVQCREDRCRKCARQLSRQEAVSVRLRKKAWRRQIDDEDDGGGGGGVSTLDRGCAEEKADAVAAELLALEETTKKDEEAKKAKKTAKRKKKKKKKQAVDDDDITAVDNNGSAPRLPDFITQDAVHDGDDSEPDAVAVPDDDDDEPYYSRESTRAASPSHPAQQARDEPSRGSRRGAIPDDAEDQMASAAAANLESIMRSAGMKEVPVLRAAISSASDCGVNVHSAQKLLKRLSRAVELEQDLRDAIASDSAADLAKVVTKARATPPRILKLIESTMKAATTKLHAAQVAAGTAKAEAQQASAAKAKLAAAPSSDVAGARPAAENGSRYVGLNVSGIGIPIDGHARAQSPGKSVHPDRFHSGDGGAPHLTAEVPGSRGVSIVQDAGLLAWDHPVPSENRPSRAAPGLARAAGHPGGVPRNAPTRAPVPTAVATDPPSVGQADRSPNRGGRSRGRGRRSGGVGVPKGASHPLPHELANGTTAVHQPLFGQPATLIAPPPQPVAHLAHQHARHPLVTPPASAYSYPQMRGSAPSASGADGVTRAQYVVPSNQRPTGLSGHHGESRDDLRSRSGVQHQQVPHHPMLDPHATNIPMLGMPYDAATTQFKPFKEGVGTRSHASVSVGGGGMPQANPPFPGPPPGRLNAGFHRPSHADSLTVGAPGSPTSRYPMNPVLDSSRQGGHRQHHHHHQQQQQQQQPLPPGSYPSRLQSHGGGGGRPNGGSAMPPRAHSNPPVLEPHPGLFPPPPTTENGYDPTPSRGGIYGDPGEVQGGVGHHQQAGHPKLVTDVATRNLRADFGNPLWSSGAPQNRPPIRAPVQPPFVGSGIRSGDGSAQAPAGADPLMSAYGLGPVTQNMWSGAPETTSSWEASGEAAVSHLWDPETTQPGPKEGARAEDEKASTGQYSLFGGSSSLNSVW